MEISTIGIDLAKSVFQVHAVNPIGEIVLRRQLRRQDVLKFFGKLPRCLVGMEACASAHHWAREIATLGHEVRLMPPRRVKAYVKWGKKNDATDAEAICEAVTRPNMQFVPIKSVEQQSALMLHRVRKLLVEQRTRTMNALRAHAAELGMITAKGDAGATALLALVCKGGAWLPDLARQALMALIEQIRSLNDQISLIERSIRTWHEGDATSQLLATIPQIGVITASALVGTVGDAARFKNGRQFAAWIGLVPLQNSSGGKDRLGGITKCGDRYLRTLLVIAATGMLRRIEKDPALFPWFADMVQRKPAKVAAVALANKLARIAWAMLVTGEQYRAPTTQRAAA
jgi:transposase